MKGVPGLPPPPDSGCFCSPRRLQRLNPQSQERAGAQFQDPSRRAQGPLLPELRDGTGEAGPVPALPSAGPTHHPTPPLLPAPPPASGSALHPWLEEARLWATALGCFCFPCSLFPADVAKAVELLGPLLPPAPLLPLDPYRRKDQPTKEKQHPGVIRRRSSMSYVISKRQFSIQTFDRQSLP